MLTVGPTTVTGAAFVLRPGTSGTTQLIFDRVVLANHSQYLLMIQTGPIKVFIDPWTVNIFPYSSDADPDIQCTPSLIATLINGASSYITAQFYRPEEPDIGVSFPSPISSPIDAALAVAQQGAPPIDRPSFLTLSFPVNLAPAGVATFGPFDATRFNSHSAWYAWDAAVTGYLRIRYTWSDVFANASNEDEVVINGQGAGSPTTSHGAFVTGPCRAPNLTISLTNEGAVAANYSFELDTSLRTLTGFRCIEDNATDNIIFKGQNLPGALSTAVTYFPLFSGNVSAGITPVGTAGQVVRVRLLTPSGDAMLDRNYTIGTTNPEVGLPLVFPRAPMNVSVQNLGAGPGNGVRMLFTGEERN